MSGYLYKDIVSPRKYANLQPYRWQTLEGGSYTVCSNGNNIEIHKIEHNGLALQNKYVLFATIAKIVTLPSQYKNYDYLWILDQLGRYGCWDPEKGLTSTCNVITVNSHGSYWSQEIIKDEKRLVMAGQTHIYEDKDTVGTIFFTSGSNLSLIEYVINRDGIFFSEPMSQNLFPGTIIRYVDWVYTIQNQVLLGIISENVDQQTYIDCYQVKKGSPLRTENSCWKLGKKNLLHFCSNPTGDILITTYDEIALHKYKIDQPLKCYRTKGVYGQGFTLENGLYGHIGKQVVVFSRDQLRSYNQFRFKDNSIFQQGGFVQGNYLGESKTGGKVVGLITHRNQVIVLDITMTSCQMHPYSPGIMTIKMVKLIEGQSTKFVIVSQLTNNCYRISLLEHLSMLRTIRSQAIPFVWDTLHGTIGGNYLIVGSSRLNFVMRLSRNHSNQYEFYFKLPPGDILHAYNNLIAVSSGIYQLDYQTQQYQVLAKGQILLGHIIEEDAYFLDSQGTLHLWEGETEELLTVSVGRLDDYCWGSTSCSLLCVYSSAPTTLCIIDRLKQRNITIKGHTMVTALAGISSPKYRNYISDSELIVVGYADGSIHLHSQTGQTINVFNLPLHNNISVFFVSPYEVFVLCGTKQFVMQYQKHGVNLKEIALGNNPIRAQAAVYNKKSNSMFFISNQPTPTIIQVQYIRRSQQSTLTTSHQSTIAYTHIEPLIIVTDLSVIAAYPNFFEVYDIRTRKSCNKLHCLPRIVSFTESAMGILLLGINKEQQPTLVLLNRQLHTIATIHPTVQVPLIDLFPTSDHSIIIVSQQNITCHRYSPHKSTTKLLSGIQLNLYPHQIALHPQLPFIAISDQFQHLSLFHFSDNSFQLRVEQLPSCLLTAFNFLEDVVVIADQRGVLNLTKIQSGQTFKKVGQLSLGKQIIHFFPGENPQILYFITEDWEISYLKAIDKDKLIEDLSFPAKQDPSEFNYCQWRSKRTTDRLIDGVYLEKLMTKEATSDIRQRVIELFAIEK